ncbi:hypothetical protein [Nocardioides renjunii]|uniref:hypothetical protein n=1 Tax=Nocardioides renjunii TaxID=3095075 RepID=UPI002B00253E|nr:hypothetical protein [Nocardioides sp. S-34]WQQ20459.1 hypothetical protein SHK17_11120 [Nocardioides sp. S-34]
MSKIDVREEDLQDASEQDVHEPETDWAAELSPRRPASRRSQIFLAALVVCALGFLGGIVTTQQMQEQTSSALPGGMELPEGLELPDGFEPPAGGAAPGGGGAIPDAGQLAALGGSSTYTVTVVDGGTLYLKDATGSTVKVVTLPTTEVRKLTAGATSDLRPGNTVTVEGDVDDAGTILAEVVAQTE